MKVHAKLASFLFMAALFLLGTSSTTAQVKADDIVGTWVTVDDETGKAKSHVKIYKQGGKYYGKVVKILDPNRQNVRCSECDEDDPRYNQKVLNMVIMRDLAYDAMDDGSPEFDDGDILDPNNGSVYSCTAVLIDANERPSKDVLRLKGWWGFFSRSQFWYRVGSSAARAKGLN